MLPDNARPRRLLPWLQTKSKLPLAVSSREQQSRFALGLLFAWFEISFDPFQVPKSDARSGAPDRRFDAQDES
jgi:hypothetical protein